MFVFVDVLLFLLRAHELFQLTKPHRFFLKCNMNFILTLLCNFTLLEFNKIFKEVI